MEKGNFNFRSSEAALEMMLKFKHIETREIIQKKLMQKFDVILDQYTKEILTVDDNFTVSSFVFKTFLFSANYHLKNEATHCRLQVLLRAIF